MILPPELFFIYQLNRVRSQLNYIDKYIGQHNFISPINLKQKSHRSKSWNKNALLNNVNLIASKNYNCTSSIMVEFVSCSRFWMQFFWSNFVAHEADLLTVIFLFQIMLLMQLICMHASRFHGRAVCHDFFFCECPPRVAD